MEITGFMQAFMAMGDLVNEEQSLEQKVASKERIVFATMKNQIPGWQKPRDWETLTDEVKLERLEKIQNMDL